MGGLTGGGGGGAQGTVKAGMGVTKFESLEIQEVEIPRTLKSDPEIKIQVKKH